MNSRLDTLQAAILLAKLPALEEERAARTSIAQYYGDGLGDLVQVPCARRDVEPAWSYYTILAEQRDALANGLAMRGIASTVYYPRPLHHQPAYAGFPRAPDLRVAEALAAQVLSLPMHADLGRDDQARIIDTISALAREKGA